MIELVFSAPPYSGGAISLVFGDEAPAPTAAILKAWTGTEWKTGPLKRYDGATWVEHPLSMWSGSEWVLLN
jgi:hypothetical protein